MVSDGFLQQTSLNMLMNLLKITYDEITIHENIYKPFQGKTQEIIVRNKAHKTIEEIGNYMLNELDNNRKTAAFIASNKKLHQI